MIWFTFIDREESAISSPEAHIVLSESTKEEEQQTVDVQKEIKEG